MRNLTVPEVADSAPGFALDILDPATRSEVAAHLIRCDGCRETVTSMQCSAAELLDLGGPAGWASEPWAPEAGAQGGWAQEGWAQEGWAQEGWPPTEAASGYLMEPSWPGDRAPARSARRRFRMAVTIATAALLVVGTTLGPELEQAAGHPERPSATIALTASGVTVGAVAIYTGRVEAIDISVRNLPESGTMEVVVVDGSGTATEIGRIEVVARRGDWLGPPGPNPRQLRTVVIVDSQRRQIASASLAS
ncbi:MAG: hypothetical protein M0Z30_13225 [Actinomycetota bacterium]|nr:hypothetical protein [Actinomycetota bacterium]